MSDKPDPPRWTQPGVDLPANLAQALHAGRGQVGTASEVSELARRLSAVLGPAAGLPTTPDGASVAHGPSDPSAAGNPAPGARAPLPAAGVAAGAGASAAARALSWRWAAALLGGAGLAAAWMLGAPTQEGARETPVVEVSPPDAAGGRAVSVPVSDVAEPVAPGVVTPPLDPASEPSSPTAAREDGVKPLTSSGSPAGARRTTRRAVPPVTARGRGEAALLESAREALAARPAQALELTRQHAARFPSGALAEEREAIAIDALRRLGRGAAADARAAAFEHRYRGSVHQPRSSGSNGAKPPAAGDPTEDPEQPSRTRD